MPPQWYYPRSEESSRGMDSVILRRSRRIRPPNERFLPLAGPILRCAQDDKQGARICHNSYQDATLSTPLEARPSGSPRPSVPYSWGPDPVSASATGVWASASGEGDCLSSLRCRFSSFLRLFSISRLRFSNVYWFFAKTISFYGYFRLKNKPSAGGGVYATSLCTAACNLTRTASHGYSNIYAPRTADKLPNRTRKVGSQPTRSPRPGRR